MPGNSRASIAVAFAALLVAACHDAAAPDALRLSVTAGENQHARIGHPLPSLVVVQLRDGSKGAVAGATITWQPTAGSADVISPLTATTDASGFARATWRFDSTPGNHVLSVSAAGAPALAVDAFADTLFVTDTSVHVLSLVSYDGSGQLVHPDFARVPDAWGDGPYRLAATPFPRSQATLENPSLFAGASLTAFVVPDGVQNPIVRPDSGYLSDPDMVFEPDASVLWLYYRKVTTANEIWLRRSSDGVHWTADQLVVQAPNQMVVSPTIVRRGANDWWMWSVNAGVEGCIGSSTTVELRRSTDGVTWSDPATVDLPETAGAPWHIDVEWIASRGEYWAVYPIKPAGNCNTFALRFATSSDGLHWRTYPSPVLAGGAIAAFQDIVYRASMDHDAAGNSLTLYYSGAYLTDSTFTWSIAYEQLTDAALLARVNTPSAAVLGDRVAPIAHPLTNATAP